MRSAYAILKHMSSVSRGYTIVELMIVMALSLMLVLMAATFLAGRKGHTEFSQSMRDLQSRLQSWIDDVPNGFAFGSNTNSYCKTGGVSVQINQGARPGGNKPECIYLGKAIQFSDNPSTQVYAYSVFGQRLDSAGNLVSTIEDAGPTPASGTAGTGNADFTETYNLKGGAHLKKIIQSSGVTGSGQNSHLAAFYLSLNTDEVVGQNGNSNLVAYQYPVGNQPNVNDPQVIHCIQNLGTCKMAVHPPFLTKWELCFDNDSNKDTALLTLQANSSGLGISTKLEFKTCP